MSKHPNSWLLLAGVLCFIVILDLAPTSASSANLSHSYHASSNIPYGSIVSLDPKQSDYVDMANTSNASRIEGVAVATSDSLLAVDPENGAVQVATSGNVNTLVSTLDGNINVGDQISASPFNGVGMKSLPGSRIIGLAETAFDNRSPGAYKEDVGDISGKSIAIWIGYVRLSIAVGTDTSDAGAGQQVNGLQQLVKDLTGHTVSTFRIITSLAVMVVSTLALIVLIYASIYGTIISVGRNPLAKYTVFRTLGSVLAMAALVALVASLTIFSLLS